MWHLNRWGGRALPLDVDAFGWAVVGLLLVVLLVDRHLSFRSNEQYPRYMPVRQGQSQLVGQSINQTNHSMGASQITVKLRLSVRTSVRLSVTQYLLRWFPCSHEFHDQVTQTDPQNIFTVPSSNRCTELQTPIRTTRRFVGSAPLRRFASFCTPHCSTCVALPIKAMMTWRRPRLPPVHHQQSP